MYLKVLSHPIFVSLNFHMPMIVDLSHPLVMLEGENGSGKSTLLHSIYLALRGEEVGGFAYKLDTQNLELGKVMLFDAEQHNPRNKPELFDEDPQMKEFITSASHGQVMLSLFSETFPAMPDGSVLLLDEPEMALSQSNQRRILKMLKELVDKGARPSRQEKLPDHRGDALAAPALRPGDLRHQPRSSRQPQRHHRRHGRRGRQHDHVAER